MAHFYGTLQSNRGPASRLGTKKSQMVTYCASWEGAICCHAYHDEKTGIDVVHVELSRWRGEGISRELYHGPISGKPIENAKAV